MEKQQKDRIRKQFLKTRDALKPADRLRDSASIRQRVFSSVDWRTAQTVLMYVSFRSEVDTHKLLQDALAQKKRVVLPVSDRNRKEIGLSELQAYGDLAPGSFEGIYEPAVKLRKRVDPSEVQLVLIPGVAFDRQGGRIGMGGGYFDRLLVEMPKARRLGLAFSVQVSEKPLPVEPHDIHVQLLITEKESITIP